MPLVISVVVTFSLVFFSYQHLSEAVMGNETDKDKEIKIEEMVEHLQNQGAEIDGWSIYERQEIAISDLSAFKQKLSELKKIYPQFQWEMHSNQEIWKATATHFQKDLHLQEKIQLISTHTNASKISYLLYEVKVDGWNQQKWVEITESLVRTTSKIFNESVKKYSCVKGHFGDKMISGLHQQTKAILQEFDATEIEKLSEGSFTSVSAYTENWKNVLPTKNHKKMNLQIALRKAELGGKTTVVVGTPIITTEY